MVARGAITIHAYGPADNFSRDLSYFSGMTSRATLINHFEMRWQRFQVAAAARIPPHRTVRGVHRADLCHLFLASRVALGRVPARPRITLRTRVLFRWCKAHALYTY